MATLNDVPFLQQPIGQMRPVGYADGGNWRGERDYRRLAGEVEARNVQARRDFNAEQRRATPPWLTQDVPDDQQIVRGGR